MKIAFDKKKFFFYLWVGMAFCMVWLIGVVVSEPAQFVVRSLNYLWAAIYLTVLNFIFFEYAIPYIRKKRKFILVSILLAIFFLWVFLMLYGFGLYFWRWIGIQLHIYTSLKVFTSVTHAVAYHFPLSLSSIIFFGVVVHVYNYLKLKQAAQQLRIQKQQAELNYLRSQTNPHFLFNTLNNIYALSRDKSDLAPESILRLSKILRFMLYETGGAYIAIEQELKIINDYIALEKLRYDESLRVNFNYNIEEMKQSIPPLLLIPLIENAFKHGVSETRHQPYVDIHLTVHQRQLALYVKNSSDGAVDRQVKENIGLSNLRRQLELLYREYELSVRQEDAQFIAVLKINLGSHV
jgi:two-component system LytT family sensor kinase